jgi:hypothetical protein
VRSVRDDIGAVAVSMRDTERETQAGAKLAEEAGTSLESIFSVIEWQAREIDIINQMAMQQQQSSSEVVLIMQVVSESTEESSASTREAAQNMERVARLAEQLLASVEAFKLRESLNYLAPNARVSRNFAAPEENQEGLLTASGSFRTVTSTAQSVGSPGYNPSNPGYYPESFPALPSAGSEGSFPQYSPVLPGQGNGGSQQFFPSPLYNSGQRPFTPEANTPAEASQWPSPNDWQSGGWNPPSQQ